MENNLARLLERGIKTMQALTGRESVIINSITYPCIVGTELVHLPLEDGGIKEVASASISIALCDILKSPVAPAIGNPCSLTKRSRAYRVDSISATQTTWEITLMSLSK